MTTFSGQAQVRIYQALVLRAALQMKASTGMIPNKHWTPTKMLALASHITGKTFRRGQYDIAATALGDWLDEQQGR